MSESFHHILELQIDAGQKAMASGERTEIYEQYGRFKNVFIDSLEAGASELPALEDACRAYDHLLILLWRSKIELSQLDCFNLDVLEPFVRFINKHPWIDLPENRCTASEEKPVRIAYLAQWNQFGWANAIPRVTWTYIMGHQALRRGKNPIMVYCTEPPTNDMEEAAQQASVSLHNLWLENNIVEIAKAVMTQAQKDRIDALIVDTPTSLATLLFAKRAAPVQAFLEMGLCSWRAQNLDFLFQGITRDWSLAVDSADQCAATPRNVHIDFLMPDRSREAIEELRQAISSLPVSDSSDSNKKRIVYGFYGRISKITSPWLYLVEKILGNNPRSVCYIGGTGGNAALDDFLKHSLISDRIFYKRGFVDGHVVGRVIDVFLDTFPFPGGLSCLESQAKGVPVVWLAGAADKLFNILEQQRDIQLKAESQEDFVRIAAELSEPAKLSEAVYRAKKLARAYCNGDQGADIVEERITKMIFGGRY
jgi:predicted O-linked N-acetylglucosamine transferase (SPINDLY family)